MARPLFHALVRLRVAAGLREHGHSVLDARHLSESLTSEVIDAQTAATPEAVGAIGDGTIIQAIVDFFKSPAGQQLIQALIQLLIGLIPK